MISQCIEFEVSRFTRCEAMNGGAKCRKWAGLGQLIIIIIIVRLFLTRRNTTKTLQGRARSWAMPPFDRAHTTSYSTLLETMRLSCTVFQI